MCFFKDFVVKTNAVIILQGSCDVSLLLKGDQQEIDAVYDKVKF